MLYYLGNIFWVVFFFYMLVLGIFFSRVLIFFLGMGEGIQYCKPIIKSIDLVKIITSHVRKDRLGNSIMVKILESQLGSNPPQHDPTLVAA